MNDLRMVRLHGHGTGGESGSCILHIFFSMVIGLPVIVARDSNRKCENEAASRRLQSRLKSCWQIVMDSHITYHNNEVLLVLE